MGSLAAYLRLPEFTRVDMCLLDENGLHNAEAILNDRAMHNIIIAKPNFKDFREMLVLIENLKASRFIDRIFLCGPFAKLKAGIDRS